MKEINLLKKTVLIWGLCLLLAPSARTAESTNPDTPWPGKQSSFHSFVQHNFKLEGLNCKVVVPEKIDNGKPWVWRARCWGHQPQTDLALLNRGFHVVYADVGGLYGSAKAVKRWDVFYKYLVESHGFEKKAVLEGMSRGGLIIFNWAAQNPEKVHCIYADAPVCDFKSWPGINKAIMNVYGLTKEQAETYKGNPVDNLKPLANAGIQLLHVVGDADKVVPVAENTAVIEKRYKELGGTIEVIHKKGIGHHPHSLKDPQPIVDFILKHAQQENSPDKK
jgi:pimeloyl-ACP methyl ester carboxylesterase